MKVFLYCVLVGSVIEVVKGLGDALIGDGVWDVISLKKCENDEKYLYRINVEKKKISRTCDGFNAWFDFNDTLSEDLPVRLDICKHVDGGCKDYQKMSDDSVANFVVKFAEENLKSAMELAKIDPPQFPVAGGAYEVLEFVLDKCEFPCRNVFGKFEATTILMNKNNEEVACLVTTVEFREPEDEAEICEKCK